MTFKELYENVSHLAFTSSIEDTKQLFIDACNRGIKQVSRIRPRMKAIPFKPSEHGDRVDVREHVSDEFGRLPRNPLRYASGTLVPATDYTYLNLTTIMLLNGQEAEYIIDYECAPQHFNHDDFSSKLDIHLDEDLCDLLVLLVAAYVLLDDRPEQAGQYMSLYREREAQIRETQSTHAPGGYCLTTGW